MMTFEEGLFLSNYIYDPQVGSYMKEDSKGNLHTYMHIEDDTWNYEKYDENDNVLVSKSFTLDWFMKLTKDQTKELASAYCEHIIDGMDLDTLCQLAHDLLMDAYENMDSDEIQDEILDLYDEDTLGSLMESVTL